MNLDSVDHHILVALQSNARVSNADIARDLNMAPSAILERIRKLEQRGVLLGYEARISPKLVGLGLTALIFVRAEERTKAMKTGQLLAAISEVQEVHNVAGEDCYVAKVRVRDTDELAKLLREKISSIATVRSTRTTIVLETIKETAQLSLHNLQTKLEE